MKAKNLATIVTLTAAFLLVSCKSEKELVLEANAFVSQMGGEYAVVKSTSKVYGYAVLLNTRSGKYMAINLENWKSTDDAYSHLEKETQKGRVYFNIKSKGAGDYEDRDSGKIFEGSEVIAKDGQAQAGFVEQLNIEAAKVNLMNAGISSEKAADIAPIIVAKAQKDSLNTEDLNAVLEVVGNTSLAELSAAQSNPLAQKELLDRAADLHGMTSEQMKDVVSNLLQ